MMLPRPAPKTVTDHLNRCRALGSLRSAAHTLVIRALEARDPSEVRAWSEEWCHRAAQEELAERYLSRAIEAQL